MSGVSIVYSQENSLGAVGTVPKLLSANGQLLTSSAIVDDGTNVTIPGRNVAIDQDKLMVNSKIIPNTFFQTFLAQGAAAATAANYGIAGTVPTACKIVSVTERHATAGTDAGAVTAMVNKAPSGTAIGAGTNCLSAGINLKAAADTNQAGTLNATPANYTFAAGDSWGVALTGVPTSLANVTVTVEFQRV